MRRTMMLTALVSLLTATFVLAGPALAAKTTTIHEKGSGTTETVSEEGCQQGGTCTDRIEGSIFGKPVDNRRAKSSDTRRAGITGKLSADYGDRQADGTFPVTGELVLHNRDGGRLELSIEGHLTIVSNNAATLDSDFNVTGSEGKLGDVRGGSGTMTAQIQDNGDKSTFTSVFDGELQRKRN